LRIGILALVFGFGAISFLPAQTSSSLNAPDTPRIAELTKMIQGNLADASTLVERGEAYASLGQPERAIADLNKAVVLAPNDNTILNGVGGVLFNLHEFKSALQFWLRASEISRYEGQYDNYRVALGYWGVTDLTTAAYYYDRFVAIDKDFANWNALQKRLECCTNFEKHATYQVFDAWRRGYKARGEH